MADSPTPRSGSRPSYLGEGRVRYVVDVDLGEMLDRWSGDRIHRFFKGLGQVVSALNERTPAKPEPARLDYEPIALPPTQEPR